MLATNEPPVGWKAARPKIVAEHAALGRLLLGGTDGYGVTTLVGHRDREPILGTAASDLAQDEFQRDLLDTHRLPARRWATDRQVRCISAAKAQLLSNGGTGVDPEIYDLVALAAVDEDFRPRVPSDASYSCGDVIPAAWWAEGLLTQYGGMHLGPKQGLTLINGVFVHAGYCLAAVEQLSAMAGTLRIVATAALVAGRAKLGAVELAEELQESWEEPPLVTSTSDLPNADRRELGQDPVAIRATASVILAVRRAVAQLESALERVLTSPSDNPVLWNGRLVEQDSFMSVELAIATSGVIEAVLVCATWTERLISWLCSGRTGLPPDLRDDTGLGLIQVPKLALAHVERLRHELGIRTFASGASTSHGIEDLWTNGLGACAELDQGLHTLHELLALAAATTTRAIALGAPTAKPRWAWHHSPGKTFRDDVAHFRETFAWGNH
ncbi:aromatic amino acid lyase [Kribbella sp. NPDC004138]